MKNLPILDFHNFASTHLAETHDGRKKGEGWTRDIHLAFSLNTDHVTVL